MIKPLRKRHLQVWIALAVLIPAGIAAAIAVIPKPAKDKLFQPGVSEALLVVLKTIDRATYTVRLRSNTDTTMLQLEWVNKNVLSYPTALIYQLPSVDTDIENAGSGAVIIGRIEATGIYHFQLKKDAVQLTYRYVLYDIIHHQKIDSFIFQ